MQIKIEKSAFEALFSILQAEGRSLVICIIQITLLLPVPSFHGTDSTGLVLLRFERNLVLRDLGEIVRTVVHSLTYSGEADAVLHLERRRRGATFVDVLRTDVEPVAVVAHGLSHAVGTDEVIAARVLTAFVTRFGESSGDGTDTNRPSNFCHSS